MADSLESESAQALLTFKNGGFYGTMDPLSEPISSDTDAIDTENGENLQEEDDDFMNENSNDSRPGFLSALGLHPAGKNGASTRQTPEKKSSSLLYNRRGTPQRIRKKNRLYFDDDHVSGAGVRGSPKKSPAPSRGERAADPTTPVRSRLTPLRAASDASAASPSRGSLTTPKKTPTRAAAVAAAAQLQRMASSSPSERERAPGRPPSRVPAPSPAPPSDAGRVSIIRQREAHALGLRLRNLLKLPKAHKFVCYEWFYSTIDECLFSGSNDFLICLKEQFPKLKTTRLTRTEWCKIRRQMGKPRRCSPAFFAEERSVLETLRQKVRAMQGQQRRSFDRAFFKNLPDEVPIQLSIGTRVTARLRTPQDGLFTGVIQALDGVNATYRVLFDKAGLDPQSVPDYEVRAIDPVDTVPTASFARAGSARPSTAFSTPPRFSLPELRSPLANDPLMSAGTPSKSELRLLDQAGVVNGYSIKFLVHVVRLNKILLVKRERVSRLESMNGEAERAQLYGQPLTDEFQRRYAQLVLQLESINSQLRETTTDVQQCCQQLMPENGLVPAVLPTHMKTLCDEEAGRQVSLALAVRTQRSQPLTNDPQVLQLITRLTSLLLQVKNFADAEMNPFELSSLEETMREIRDSLQPEHLADFQDQVQVHLQHVQTGLTQRWNSGRAGRRPAAGSSTAAAASPGRY